MICLSKFYAAPIVHDQFFMIVLLKNLIVYNLYSTKLTNILSNPQKLN